MHEICTTTSPKTGNFFDLSPLLHHDWHVPGLDYGSNFSISFCGPLTGLSDDSNTQYTDLETDHESQNSASASYTDEATGKTYSLGKSDSHPFFRGRELVLEYHGGSFCRDPSGKVTGLRKSSVVNFKCDHEMTHHVLSPALVGQLSDCAYFFEVKTPHACAVLNQEQSMQPVTIFFFIVAVAGIVGFISSQLGKGGKLQFDSSRIGQRIKRVLMLLWVVVLRIVMAPFRVVKSRRLPL
ncbi:putative mannose 6-phosphate receptor-like protein [Yarrowia sp. B02]|nr:putative mannose 6-phosphate receptor-like protein [Yarrowia sp. B02]